MRSFDPSLSGGRSSAEMVSRRFPSTRIHPPPCWKWRMELCVRGVKDFGSEVCGSLKWVLVPDKLMTYANPPPPSFLPSLIGSNPRDTWFCYWSVAWPSSSSYPSCSYYSCGQRGLFSSPLLPPPHPTVKKSKLCSFLISYIFLNLSDSEVVPWVCSQWKFLLCLALEVWPLPGKQHISWFIEWSIWIWA